MQRVGEAFFRLFGDQNLSQRNLEIWNTWERMGKVGPKNLEKAIEIIESLHAPWAYQPFQ